MGNRVTKNGARSNNDPRNDLLLEMSRLVKDFLPKSVMIENVPGLETQQVFSNFIDELIKLGYHPNWKVLDVSKYGVPQRRKRLVMLAGYGFEIPFGNEAKKIYTVRMSFEKAKLGKAGQSSDPLHDMPEKRTEAMKKRIAMTPKDGGSRKDLPEEYQLPCHRRAPGFNDVYGRMAWDDVSPTITCGCFNPSKGRFLHPEEDRNITMREAAILQTFPEKFKVLGGTSKSDAAQMIGNALPPEFVKRHAEAIQNTFKKITSK